MQKTYFNWSTGKDSALALYYLQKENKLNVDLLVTTINKHFDRVSMHGLRRELLEKQAKAIGIPLQTIELPEMPSMLDYENIMNKELSELKTSGYSDTIFGDIFLEDLRKYREKELEKFNIKAHFPLWKKDTKELIYEFIDLEFKAIVVSINANLLDKSFVGRVIDKQFVADLPTHVDPCGENGEFHTFCFDGPIFKKPIDFTIGEIILKEYKTPKSETKTNQKDKMGFWYCDLL